MVGREGGPQPAGVEGGRLEDRTDRPGGRGLRFQIGIAGAPACGHETLRAIVETADPPGTQVGFAADIVGPRVAACDNGRLGLLAVRGAEPLRPRTADAPAVEQVPRRGDLWLGYTPEVGIMLVPSR